MEEDIKAVAKHTGEVRVAASSIQDDLGQLDRGSQAGAGSEGLQAVAAQFEKDRATTTTAS